MNEEVFSDVIKAETSQSVEEPVHILCEAIKARGKIACILFYGSGLWKPATPNTIYDFYVLVDRFRDFDARLFPAILGYILPPNVYALKTEENGQVFRCKYAVMRKDQFYRAVKGRALTPQIWARFAQPCRILYLRDETMRAPIIGALMQAIVTFHRKTLPLTSVQSNPSDIWQRGLKETYAAELRSEKPGRTKELFDANASAYIKRTQYALPLLQHIARDSKNEQVKSVLKRPLQKLIAFLRLAKATLTFDDALDYALWKIERQSGIHMEATDFQRRYPLLAAWPIFWKLIRKGGVR